MTNNEVLLGTTDYRDFYITSFIKDRVAQNLPTITVPLCVTGTDEQAVEFIKTHWPDKMMFSAGTGRIVVNADDAIIEFDFGSNNLNVRFHSTLDRIEELRKLVLATFEEVSVYISWVYNRDMSSITVPVDRSLTPVDEMYPFLQRETLESYYKRFFKSRANILILIGPPGTGKTSFIRGALIASQAPAMVTYDQQILSEDRLFAEFIESDASTLVIEDADLFLSSRADGNGMMHKFLNVGDGLVTVAGKKMIFSTNLPSINDIDEALLRPGRCFDVLHFGELDRNEAQLLVDKLGSAYKLDTDKIRFTIAEIFTGSKNADNKQLTKPFGFA